MVTEMFGQAWRIAHDFGDEVEQMYVGERFRGTGAAGELLTHAESLITRDFDRGWLAVVAGNDRAIGFYDSLGARPVPGWIPYRLEGEALAALAGTAPRRGA